MVTHSHEIVEKMHKRVIYMERGCVVGDETAFDPAEEEEDMTEGGEFYED